MLTLWDLYQASSRPVSICRASSLMKVQKGILVARVIPRSMSPGPVGRAQRGTRGFSSNTEARNQDKHRGSSFTWRPGFSFDRPVVQICIRFWFVRKFEAINFFSVSDVTLFALISFFAPDSIKPFYLSFRERNFLSSWLVEISLNWEDLQIISFF